MLLRTLWVFVGVDEGLPAEEFAAEVGGGDVEGGGGRWAGREGLFEDRVVIGYVGGGVGCCGGEAEGVDCCCW